MLTITLVKIISLSICSTLLKFNSASTELRDRASIKHKITELGHKKHKEIYLKDSTYMFVISSNYARMGLALYEVSFPNKLPN